MQWQHVTHAVLYQWLCAYKATPCTRTSSNRQQPQNITCRKINQLSCSALSADCSPTSTNTHGAWRLINNAVSMRPCSITGLSDRQSGIQTRLESSASWAQWGPSTETEPRLVGNDPVMVDWVKVLHPTPHKIGHFGDILPSSQPISWRSTEKTKLDTTKASNTRTN